LEDDSRFYGCFTYFSEYGFVVLYTDDNPQATVVLFPYSLFMQSCVMASMGITNCASSLFVSLFLGPQSLTRGGSAAYMDQI